MSASTRWIRRPVCPPAHLSTLAIVAALHALGACADPATAPTGAQAAPPDAPALVPTETPSRAVVVRPTSGPWAQIVEGAVGPSRYALHVPRDWNGSAVYYAHGFRDAGPAPDLRDQDGFYALRERLGAQGYAVAWSSYATNGFAVLDGSLLTLQLRPLLAARLPGPARRHLLMGHSLGGGIALQLAERFPGQYDGALLVCGMVGGSLPQTQYLGHARALFDHYYPGVIPGSALGVPAGTTVTLPQVAAAVQTNPLGLFAIGSTAQTPLPYVPIGDVTNPATPAFQTLVGSLFGAVSFQVRGVNDLVERVGGRSAFGNRDTQYATGTPLLPGAALGPLLAGANAGVARYTLAPLAQLYLTVNFTPTGRLRVPVLTLHNTWDPAVPLFHETLLRERVQAAGATSRLLQRQVPSYGHCAISGDQVMQSFGDLVGWVESGVRPPS